MIRLHFSRGQILFYALAVLILISMAALSEDFGVTWDEGGCAAYGTTVLRNILSGGIDQSYLKEYNLFLYGSFFHIVTAFVHNHADWQQLHAFAQTDFFQRTDWFNYFQTSHFVNAMFGFFAILYAALLTKDIAGWRAACLALLFMTLSPRFFGNAMNNPKDIPFAMSYIFSLYYMRRYLIAWPKTNYMTMAMLAIGFMFAIGTRPGGGLFLMFYFASTTLIFGLITRRISQLRNLAAMLGTVLSICLIGYFSGLIFWPYGQLHPLLNALDALKQTTKFEFWNGQVLFEGTLRHAADLPWYYAIKWILISSPIFLPFSLLLFSFCFHKLLKQHGTFNMLFLVSVTVFPIMCTWFGKSILYDSWRHLLFIYPTLICLIALTWDLIFARSKSKLKKILIGLMIGLQLMEPLSWMVKNHPNEYVYFSPLIGGLNHAFDKYEADYWGNSQRRAAEWLVHYHEMHHPGKPLKTFADGNPFSTAVYFRKLAPIPAQENMNPALYQLMAGHADPDWQYGIVLPRYWSPEMLCKHWPPKNTIYAVTADGKVLCAVVKNTARSKVR